MFGINRYGIDFKNDTGKVRVLKVLEYYVNEEVNVWKLMTHAKVCHHTECIRQLRKDYDIRNRTEWNGNIRHSYYRLNK